MSTKKSYEIIRAIFHIGTSLILVGILNYVKPTVAAPLIFIFVLLIEYLRLKWPRFNNLIINHKYSFWRIIVRHEEKTDFSPATFAALAALLISWMPLNLINAALLVNAFADPAARMFGTKWGKTKILNTKNSWVGSSAFLIVAFTVCLFFTTPLPALAAALVGTIAEFIPDKKPFWVDNLRIPIFVGLILWIII